jgi:hypothetical protein
MRILVETVGIVLSGRGAHGAPSPAPLQDAPRIPSVAGVRAAAYVGRLSQPSPAGPWGVVR